MAANTERELWQSYVRGWKDGATTKAMQEKFTKHKTRPDLTEAYEKGYAHGKKDLSAAGNTATFAYGYVPTVLRTANEED